MKEGELDFQGFVDSHTPSFGILARYPDGSREIIETFKTHFEADWWETNVTNITGLDRYGKELRGAIIVDLKAENKKLI